MAAGVAPGPVPRPRPAGWRDAARQGDAGHLDFRASLLVTDGHVTLAAVVRTHHRGGRLYLAAIRRLHPVVVRGVLRRAHREVALAAPAAGERWWTHRP
ncbi:DUF2867 domain-containing protein [Streptomyces noursei]|uniref:DUF2867 domain-containing protein n=1 Tax=Streptomyces noursei TaxID=1971 RepID=UPI003329FE51